jgi:3-phosphoshikimate 1-carboxyvinyltransferase
MHGSAVDLPDVLPIRPLSAPPRIAVTVPGSKSLTNRAVMCAALAGGRSVLHGVLLAQDTWAMLEAARALGAAVRVDEPECRATIDGAVVAGDPRELRVDARQSGTTSRFVLPVLALGAGRRVLDGAPQLRARPFGPLIAAVRELGAEVEELGAPGCLPVAVTGPLRGGPVVLPGHLTSQFLSGLLMAGALMPDGLDARLSSAPVSMPYLRMTAAVMAEFGVGCELDAQGARVAPAAYRPREYAIEPDASAASYFLASAAITGGRVTISGLGTDSLQGDVAFADVLERMGASVQRAPGSLTVSGGELRGIDVDMGDISDTAQTLAAVAVFAQGPTRIRGIGFIRRKETDRIHALVTELRRAGIDAREDEDGLTITPGAPRATRFETYDDHRMAMSLALIGLRAEGIEIRDPRCVTKTYPGYFADLAALHR